MSQPTYTCTHCGRALPLGGLLDVHGELSCPDCLDNSTVVCRCYGERIWREENYGTDDYPLCDDCYQDHFTNCVRCDALIHVDDVYYDDDDNGYCARILYFFERHWEELLKFSRRTQRQLDRWASRYGYKEHPKDILEHAKKGCHAGRYTCVNLTNSATIEFRMFR